MRACNPVYLLPQETFSVHINGDHNHSSRYSYYSLMETELNRRESFSFGAMPSSNIPDLTKARQDLPLPKRFSSFCYMVRLYDYTRMLLPYQHALSRIWKKIKNCNYISIDT